MSRTLVVVLLTLAAVLAWAGLAIYLAFLGFWMSPVAVDGDLDDFEAWAVATLEEQSPGAAALVLLDGQGGERLHFAGDGIDADTLFPTASFSKLLAALTVHALAEQGDLDLDRPAGDYLSRWQLPPSPFDREAVTVRRLLGHTAGLTDGLGFGDYLADETVPSLESSLNAPRASSGEAVIAVGQAPGEFRYSGGGYLLLELLVEEVGGRPFADQVQTLVLDPLGMTRSSYAFASELENVARSFAEDGTPAPSYRYASKAATAFNSSARDLIKLAGAMAEGSDPLSTQLLQALRTPEGFSAGAAIWGAGTMLYAPTASGDFVFGHDGANDPAINATLRVNPDNGAAFLMLVSGHPSLASTTGSEWTFWQTGVPDFLMAPRVFWSAFVPTAAGAFLMVLGAAALARRRRR